MKFQWNEVRSQVFLVEQITMIFSWWIPCVCRWNHREIPMFAAFSALVFSSLCYLNPNFFHQRILNPIIPSKIIKKHHFYREILGNPLKPTMFCSFPWVDVFASRYISGHASVASAACAWEVAKMATRAARTQHADLGNGEGTSERRFERDFARSWENFNEF